MNQAQIDAVTVYFKRQGWRYSKGNNCFMVVIGMVTHYVTFTGDKISNVITD